MSKLLSKYKSNKTIRKQIDRQLFLMARVYANLGTNSKYDERDNKSNRIKQIKEKIKNLCPIFYNNIYPYEND
tara:strand:- start:1232 stop:1450 length:219 start_codon:yes stop_codon:yes gene_type:complete